MMSRLVLCIIILFLSLEWKLATKVSHRHGFFDQLISSFHHTFHIPSFHPSYELSSSNMLHSCKKTIVTCGLCYSLGFFSIPSISLGDEIPSDSTTLMEVWKLAKDNYFDESYNGNDWVKVRSEYESKLRKGGDQSDLIKDMLSKLGDKYTRLLDKKLFESLWKYDAIGVGVLFQTDIGKPMIVASQPIPGSSGYIAGLEKGDIVYSINGESTEKMTAIDLLDRMSNDDSDSVQIEYSKIGENQRREVILRRSLEKAQNPVSYQIETSKDNHKIGYIKLSEFNAQAVSGMETAIKQIVLENADEMILDLRGNTGGGFQFALNIGGMFMKDKVMAATKARNNENNIFKTSYSPGVIWNKPVIILTDGLSASASEVLAGGLHDNCRAVIVGEKTFGKGKIQAVFGLQNGEGLTMTVAQYVTPKGTIIQSTGLIPDISSPVTNPYVNLILGKLAPTPDVKSIDYSKVEKYFKSCQAS